jgi:hypothetical protein
MPPSTIGSGFAGLDIHPDVPEGIHKLADPVPSRSSSSARSAGW